MRKRRNISAECKEWSHLTGPHRPRVGGRRLLHYCAALIAPASWPAFGPLLAILGPSSDDRDSAIAQESGQRRAVRRIQVSRCSCISRRSADAGSAGALSLLHLAEMLPCIEPEHGPPARRSALGARLLLPFFRRIHAGPCFCESPLHLHHVQLLFAKRAPRRLIGRELGRLKPRPHGRLVQRA